MSRSRGMALLRSWIAFAYECQVQCSFMCSDPDDIISSTTVGLVSHHRPVINRYLQFSPLLIHKLIQVWPRLRDQKYSHCLLCYVCLSLHDDCGHIICTHVKVTEITLVSFQAYSDTLKAAAFNAQLLI